MTDESVLDKIEHYGVKGMKWGVRRSQAQLDRAAGRTPSKSSRKDPKKAAAKARNQKVRSERRSAKKQRRTLTNQDIKSRIDRLKDERTLTKLTNEDLRPIRTKLAGMLSDAGWQVGKNVTSAAMTILVRKYVSGEKLTAAELGKYLRPKK